MSGLDKIADALSFLQGGGRPLSRVQDEAPPFPPASERLFVPNAVLGFSETTRQGGKTHKFLDGNRGFAERHMDSEVYPVPASCLADRRSPLQTLGELARWDGRDPVPKKV